MAGDKWARERAGGGDTGETMKGQMCRAPGLWDGLWLWLWVRWEPRDGLDQKGDMVTVAEVRVDRVDKWIQRDSEEPPAKTQGRDNGDLVTSEIMTGGHILDIF